MSYQYFNVVNKKTLLLNGPKKGEAYKTIYHFAKCCSGIIVGSRELAKNLAKLNQVILLNTSPTPDLQIVKTGKNRVLTVGWIGDFSGSHKEALMNNFFPAFGGL